MPSSHTAQVGSAPRMITLFLALCREAGWTVAAYRRPPKPKRRATRCPSSENRFAKDRAHSEQSALSAYRHPSWSPVTRIRDALRRYRRRPDGSDLTNKSTLSWAISTASSSSRRGRSCAESAWRSEAKEEPPAEGRMNEAPGPMGLSKASPGTTEPEEIAWR